MKTLITACLLLSVTLSLTSCWDEATLRSDKPLPRVVATKEFSGFPFPASAHSIYYFLYAGGMQDLEQYIRFDVDPQELDASVNALIAWNNKQMGRTLAYPTTPISTASISTPRPEFLPMIWWDPSSIATGYYRGHMDGHALRIYADQTRGRIYIYQND